MGENARAREPPACPFPLPLAPTPRPSVRSGGSFQIYIDVLNHIELCAIA